MPACLSMHISRALCSIAADFSMAVGLVPVAAMSRFGDEVPGVQVRVPFVIHDMWSRFILCLSVFPMKCQRGTRVAHTRSASHVYIVACSFGYRYRRTVLHACTVGLILTQTLKPTHNQKLKHSSNFLTHRTNQGMHEIVTVIEASCVPFHPSRYARCPTPFKDAASRSLSPATNLPHGAPE